jgi:predicted metal-dependent HD superfamily phosphohydrolase
MADQELLDKVKKYAIEQFEARSSPCLCFHNLAHTCTVVKTAKKIAEHGKLHKKDILLLEIAAWFHDLGYLVNPKDYKEQSAKLARIFLEHEKTPEQMIKRVTDLVMATRLNKQPSGSLEEIIYDADLSYLSKPSFAAKNELLRKETECLTETEIPLDVWYRKTETLMEAHIYYTDYGRTLFAPKKDKNLDVLRELLAAGPDVVPPVNDGRPKKIPKEHPKAEVGSEKGIETLFRIAASNNQRLFTLADNKAHILITVNSIIMSIIISVLIRKLAENPFLTWPTFLLLSSSFASTVFSILATRPKIDRGTFSQSDLDDKKVNLIYFGNFHQMPIDDYIGGMEVVMSDRVFLYQTLIRDAYWHGSVLGRKYGFLRKAYNVFLFGLGISIAAFVIAFLFHHQVPIAKNPVNPPQ